MRKIEFFDKGYGLAGVRLGLISPGQLAKYDMYKTYLQFLEDNLEKYTRRQAEIQAKKLTIRHYNSDYCTVRRAIVYFEDSLQIPANILMLE